MQEQPTNPVVRDLENPQAYSLTLRRKKKLYGSTKWEVMANGEVVGHILDGGQLSSKASWVTTWRCLLARACATGAKQSLTRSK